VCWTRMCTPPASASELSSIPPTSWRTKTDISVIRFKNAAFLKELRIDKSLKFSTFQLDVATYYHDDILLRSKAIHAQPTWHQHENLNFWNDRNSVFTDRISPSLLLEWQKCSL
jgi:hypothetical protein